MPNIFCEHHQTLERAAPLTYQVCYECHHVYNTPGELEQAERDLHNRNVPAAAIFACSYCLHDF